MFALLHLGYEMPIEREVRIAKKLKGNELGWCLGARYVSSLIFIIIAPANKLQFTSVRAFLWMAM
jgi:Golgi nucleoside diphosphatase